MLPLRVSLVFLLALGLLSDAAAATLKSKSLPVTKIAPDIGLVGTRITDIVQDQTGFMWIATQKALHRYDGHSVRVYRSDEPNDAHRLPHEDLLELFVDAENFLWISSMSGLARFDIQAETFEVMVEHSSSQKPDFYQDQQGRVWYLNNHQPYVYDHGNHSFARYDISASFSRQGIALQNITSIKMFNDEALVVVREDAPCALVLTHNNTVSFDLPEKFAAICVGAQYLEWIGDSVFVRSKDNVLYQYNRENDLLKEHLTIPPEHLTSSILVDKRGHIWIANNAVFYRIFPTSDIIHSYEPYSPDGRGLTDFAINNLYEDENGLIWIATRGSGAINIYHPSTDDYTWEDQFYSDNIDFHGTPINALFASEDKHMWVVAGADLYKIDLSSKTMEQIPFVDKNGDKVDLYLINSITKTPDGAVWLATSYGIYMYQENSDGSYLEKVFPTPGMALPERSAVLDIDYDAQGNLWFGTVKNGLYYFDRSNTTFTQFLNEPGNKHSLLDDIVIEIFVDSRQRVWAATTRGVSRISDKNTNEFTHYIADANVPSSLCGRIVEVIIEDSENNLWFATSDGLAKYSESQDNFNCIRERHGLPSSTIHSLAESTTDNELWLGTPRGLSQFNKKDSSVRTHTISDGLFGAPILRSSVVDHTGVLWFGTQNGLNRIKLDSNRSNATSPKLALTGLNVNNSTYTSAVPLNSLTQLTLPYHRNDIQFSFANLNFSDTKNRQYKVMLEPWTKDWIKLGNNNQVHFSQLAPGEYTLKVAADITTENEERFYKTLNLSISPPLWKTLPAYSLYALILGACIFLAIRLRTRQLESRTRYLEQVVKDRVHTIEQLLNKKDELFASVSHEFRTPLTLIIGPATKLLQTSKSRSVKDELGLIVTNARRLLRMVDQLLDLARQENIPASATTITDIAEVCKTILAHFHSSISERNITLNSELDDRVFVAITTDAFEKIIINLLSNAIKYSDTGGKLKVTCRQHGASAELIVTDSGYGIAPENHLRIFERFVRLENQKSHTIAGTGVGLALVKQLVEDFDGNISVISEVGQGATFVVHFPLAQDPMTQDPITQGPSILASAAADLELETLNQGYAVFPDAHSSTLTTTQQAKSTCASTPAPESAPGVDALKKQHLAKILIVEDHPDMRAFIRQSLAREFSCLEAEDGAAGLRLALLETPDLIITDLMMPNKSGFELAEALRKDIKTSHIPIVMLTAKSDLETRKRAWQSSLDEYFEKPFDADELLIRCKNLLNIRQILGRRLGHGDQTYTAQDLSFLSNRDKVFLEKLKELVSENFADSDLNATILSQALAMSESQLQRKIKALLEQSIPEYIRTYRLKKGAELLGQGMSVTEVSFAVGFSSTTYFSSCFKAHYSLTPREYQAASSKPHGSEK